MSSFVGISRNDKDFKDLDERVRKSTILSGNLRNFRNFLKFQTKLTPGAELCWPGRLSEAALLGGLALGLDLEAARLYRRL